MPQSVTQVARPTPLTPKGPREELLMQAVDSSEDFPTDMDFFRAVAKRRHTKAVTEKSAYNRIVRMGKPGDLTAARKRVYAELLNLDVEQILHPLERTPFAFEPETGSLEHRVKRLERAVEIVERRLFGEDVAPGS